MPSQVLQKSNGVAALRDPTSGALIQLSDNDPTRGTYSIFIPGVTPAATPTDILTLQGSASKLIRVRQIIITGIATAASNVQILVNRRTTPNTAGTKTNPALVAHDPSDDAATCVLALYSANPSGLGASLGIQDGGRLNLAPAANGGIDRLLLQYGWLNDKAPVLNGISDFLCIGLGGAAMPAGGNFDFSILVSED
jgi:hypothetical protein